VLVNEFGVAKLADFGCSKRLTLEGTLGEASHSSGIKGTPYFMAPEVIKNDRAGRPSDIWSLGGVAFQMATGDPPWKAMQFKTPMVTAYVFFCCIYTGCSGVANPLERYWCVLPFLTCIKLVHVLVFL